MFDFVSFIPQAVIQGIPLLYGSTGETLTEKSGNLNLGIPGIMYVGAISGVIGAFFYEASLPSPDAINSVLAVVFKLVIAITALAILGVPMTSIVAVIGSCGLAIGLALQGSLANIAGAFIAHAFTGYGYGVNTYLYFSLFLAFAALYPDMQFMMFFILPVKAKWLAAVDLLYFLIAIITGGASLRLAAIASLINVALFFGEDLYQTGRRLYFQWQRRKQWRQ